MFRNIIEYLLGCSDLHSVKVICKKSIRADKTVKLTARVQNLESCYSHETKLSFYISKDNKFQNDEDTKLGDTVIPQINAKAYKTVKISSKIPGNINPSRYFILAVINPAGNAIEINSDNNVCSKKVKIQ